MPTDAQIVQWADSLGRPDLVDWGRAFASTHGRLPASLDELDWLPGQPGLGGGSGTAPAPAGPRSPEGSVYYPDVQLPNISLPGGGQAGTPTLDWMRFLEARRQYESSMGFQRDQYESALQANPRDWIQQWYYNRGQTPSGGGAGEMRIPEQGQTPFAGPSGGGLAVPPWLQAIVSGDSIPNVQGGSSPFTAPGGLPSVMPWQTNAAQWENLNPDERQGAYGYWSSLGFNPASVNQYIQQTRPLASSMPSGGVSRRTL